MPDTTFCNKVIGYFQLIKLRVISLVVFTSFVGMCLAQDSFSVVPMLIPLFCIGIASAASASLNMWYDADIDAIMDRTKKRPIPAGIITKNEAFSFGLVLSLISVLLMKISVNDISAILLMMCILYYVIIYTMWLKRITVQNIVIGGAAGAIPPIIGCTAITGSVNWESIILFAIVFFWTPPHFWALSLTISDDYKKAGIPMMPVVKGTYKTKISIIFYTLVLVMVSVLPGLIQIFGSVYLISALVLGTYFLKISYDLLKDKTEPILVFKYSIMYLFLLLTSVIIDRIVL